MSKLFKITASKVVLAAAAGAMFATTAYADTAETKGGIKIKTEDGRFEANVNGRIHLDAYLFDEDGDPKEFTQPFGSQVAGNQERGGLAFRRTYLTLSGKLYGFKYKFENDFAAGASPASYREMWISTELGPGELTLGQFKPYRGMEELTSSNDITMIERPWTSATGVYAGRQFLMGAGYKGTVADMFGFGVDAMNLGAANTTTEGISYGGRFYFFPLSADGNALHFGLSASVDDTDTGSATAAPGVPYAGRRGPTLALGSAGAANTGANAAQTDNSQTSFGVEAAWAVGPVTLQSEYALAKLDNTHTVAGTPEDSDVQAYYLQASWFVTGEKAVYKKDRGAFGKPKPNGAAGAWELTARYDFAENKDQSATADPCKLNVTTTTGTPPVTTTVATAKSCEASTITAGVNWYLNPNVRFMLNYYLGMADRGTVDATNASVNPEDKPQAVTLRTQLSF